MRSLWDGAVEAASTCVLRRMRRADLRFAGWSQFMQNTKPRARRGRLLVTGLLAILVGALVATLSLHGAAGGAPLRGVASVAGGGKRRAAMAGATKPRILVTGGAGYIGSHTVVALVEAGYPCTIVDSLINSSEEAVRRVKKLVSHPEWIDFVKVR